LSSERAIQVNIQIMRIYTRMREILMTNKDILAKLETLENKVTNHDHDIKVVFKYLKEMLTPKPEPSRKIGFRSNHEAE
jgi:hypothetical protein